MLYISTRDRTDSFTAHRVLTENDASDGGMFVPMQMPAFRKEDILALKDKSFGDTVARILNLFFDKKISGWDIEFSVGRSPFQLFDMSHRIVVAQLWHNHGADYRYLESSIYEKLCGSAAFCKDVPQWPRIAIRIAVVFGVFTELSRRGCSCFDIAVPAGDFLLPIAIWYAGNMGLPVGMIICGCNDDSGVWDLIHRGELSTGSLEVAGLHGVERLLFDAFGREEVRRYLDVCQRRGTYKLKEDHLQMLNNRLYAVVASNQRVGSVIKSVYRTNRYALDSDTAVSYGALQDYRARTGESRLTLILADKSPNQLSK